MICKNCKTNTTEVSSFCNNCGAKVITERITVKGILSDVSQNIFGWDNRFFLTVRKMTTRPQEILGEYLDGTRKKYMNPFTFLALGSAIVLFAFNFFSEEYMALNVETNNR